MNGLSGLNAGCLGDLAGTDAPGADPNILRTSVDHRADALQIWQPTSFAHVVSVGDIAAGHRALAADFTSLRHRRVPPRDPLYKGGIKYHRKPRFASGGHHVVPVFFVSQSIRRQSSVTLKGKISFSKAARSFANFFSLCERIEG